MKKWIWIGVVAVVAIFFYATYNGFVNREEGLKSAWSNVETQYQRRADLIPNLVNTVKGYGSPVMEDKASWHHHLPNDEEYAQIIADFAAHKEAING